MRRFDDGKTKEERQAVPAIEKTCMKQYMKLWRASFLKPLYDDLAADFEAKQDALRAGGQ